MFGHDDCLDSKHLIGMLPDLFSLVMIGLVYKAYTNGCRHTYTFLPRLRPYLRAKALTGASALVYPDRHDIAA